MWLRDSSAQTIPYTRFAKMYPILRNRIAGVVERNARAIDVDVYANAFQASYHTWERKWEVDSIAWPVLLAANYLQETGDRSIFTPEFHVALVQIQHAFECEQHHATCSLYRYPYHVYTDNTFNPDTGLIWCGFRPSDDPVQYRYNIPQNMLAVVALREIAYLARAGYADEYLAQRAHATEASVTTAVLRYGIVWDTDLQSWTYVYETDGYHRYTLIDDANIPNLTAAPYIDWSSVWDPTYLATRAWTLSSKNPWYFRGRYARGLGSVHTPYGYVWPLGIIARALTSTSSREISDSITTLAETDSESGMIHESFYPDGYWRYTRAEFGWANALFSELLFRTVAGFPSSPFVRDGVIIPFEQRSVTPNLVPPSIEIYNASDIVGTLGRLLQEGR
jgi:meiotically up-regulated gene 157 (Mug157) protein